MSLNRVKHHIPLYNRTCGDPDGYHETNTVLFMRQVDKYLRDDPGISSLVVSIEDLAELCTMQWPLEYYSPERLWLVAAKAGWVEPDLLQLDF